MLAATFAVTFAATFAVTSPLVTAPLPASPPPEKTNASTVASAPSAPSAPATSSTVLSGVYRNERGSELTLEVGADGEVRGFFQSGVGKVKRGTRFALRGTANGDVLAFTVNFGGAGSVGAWVGQLHEDTLVTIWHLAKDVPDDVEAQELWGTVRTGPDAFVRVAPTIDR